MALDITIVDKKTEYPIKELPLSVRNHGILMNLLKDNQNVLLLKRFSSYYQDNFFNHSELFELKNEINSLPNDKFDFEFSLFLKNFKEFIDLAIVLQSHIHLIAD